jgi:hypothetical protein
MPLVVKDRIKETSTTSGTGTLTLAGAASGFRSFADIGNGNTTYYAIVDSVANTWEVGIGTYTSSGTTLARNTILSNSSGTTAAINFAANIKDVFVTYPSSKAVYGDASDIAYDASFAASNGIFLNANTVATSLTLPTNYNGLSAGNVTLSTGVTVTVPTGARWVIV